MSIPKVSALIVVIICLLICSNVSYLTAVTRNLFAFARKGRFPILGLDRYGRCHFTLFEARSVRS